MVLYGRGLQEVGLSRRAGVWCLSDVWSWPFPEEPREADDVWSQGWSGLKVQSARQPSLTHELTFRGWISNPSRASAICPHELGERCHFNIGAGEQHESCVSAPEDKLQTWFLVVGHPLPRATDDSKALELV